METRPPRITFDSLEEVLKRCKAEVERLEAMEFIAQASPAQFEVQQERLKKYRLALRQLEATRMEWQVWIDKHNTESERAVKKPKLPVKSIIRRSSEPSMASKKQVRFQMNIDTFHQQARTLQRKTRGAKWCPEVAPEEKMSVKPNKTRGTQISPTPVAPKNEGKTGFVIFATVTASLLLMDYMKETSWGRTLLGVNCFFYLAYALFKKCVEGETALQEQGFFSTAWEREAASASLTQRPSL